MKETLNNIIRLLIAILLVVLIGDFLISRCLYYYMMYEYADVFIDCIDNIFKAISNLPK
jgi:hypothetical protein